MFDNWIPDRMVRDTPEMRRIAALPRRVWTDESANTLSGLFTPILKTPRGTERLFPVQAQALNDAGIQRGLLAPIRVGGGKTLLSLLLPVVMRLVRPLLLVPASIKKKTRDEMMDHYTLHWQIPYQRIRIVSYEELGRDGQKNLLEQYRPDGLVCDEVHRLKNPKAAVTRRVIRWMGAHPDTAFAGFSGTITRKSMKDYAHLLKFVFPNDPPIPRGYNELEEWCLALDEKTNPLALFLHPGAMLSVFAKPQDVPPPGERTEEAVALETSIARRAVQRRITETRGVVSTVEGFEGCPLYIDHLMHDRKGQGETSVEGFIAQARSGLNPDGWLLPDGMAIRACVYQLALGFYLRWKEKPPDDWKVLRQTWYKQVREWIKHPPRNNPLDSEFQVAKAIMAGEIPDEDGIHAMWRKIEPTFTPTTLAIWIDDGAINQCADWLHKHPKGICWIKNPAFGERLAAVSGLPFHHRKGLDRNGVEIEKAHGPIIASVKSNSTGRNLQKWNTNLITSPEPNALELEQLLGRTHREKQMADEVTATFLISCAEHVDAIGRALRDARYTEDSTGQAQKLLHADLTLPLLADIKHIPSRRYAT